MRRLLVGLALLAVASTAAAQTPTTPMLEIRPMAGAFIPTGEQRDLFKDAAMYGGQLALELRPSIHILGSFAWSPGNTKFAVTEDRVNIYQYDLGAEYSLIVPINRQWDWKPFVGLGAGARTYDYRAEQFATKTCAAGYGALGTEFQYGVVGVRFEGRNYVYCFENPVVNESQTRNEVGVSAGLVWHVGHRFR